MASLTVREKEHWKERISRRLEQAAETLLAKENPTYREQIAKQAELLAKESLGIAEHYRRLDEIEEQQKQLRKDCERIQSEMLSLACGIQRTSNGYRSYDPPFYHVPQAVSRRQKVHEKELLAKDELGRRLLALDKEKDELLDTVWLATSGKQIKQLWQKVGELLSQEPTPFQKEALEIEPIEGE